MLEFDLAGWRRNKYKSDPANDGTDLRLVFRQHHSGPGIDILVIAHRRGFNASGASTTVYSTAKER